MPKKKIVYMYLKNGDFLVKNLSKNLVLPKKKKNLHVFEKWRFFAQLQRPLVLYHESKSIETFFLNSLAYNLH